MPFKSEKQRRFMWWKHPEIARRWTEEGKGNVESVVKTASRIAKGKKKKKRKKNGG